MPALVARRLCIRSLPLVRVHHGGVKRRGRDRVEVGVQRADRGRAEGGLQQLVHQIDALPRGTAAPAWRVRVLWTNPTLDAHEIFSTRRGTVSFLSF